MRLTEIKLNPFKKTIRVIDALEITERVLSQHPEAGFALGDVINGIIRKAQGEGAMQCEACFHEKTEGEIGRMFSGSQWVCSSCLALAKLMMSTMIGKVVEKIVRESSMLSEAK